ncbi:hypothetical protein Droror1_Dr00017237 [Drosera rotundifolia]
MRHNDVTFVLDIFDRTITHPRPLNLHVTPIHQAGLRAGPDRAPPRQPHQIAPSPPRLDRQAPDRRPPPARPRHRLRQARRPHRRPRRQIQAPAERVDAAKRSTELSPNSVVFSHFYANLLHEAAREQKEYEEVMAECERGLSIADPVDPAKEGLSEESGGLED